MRATASLLFGCALLLSGCAYRLGPTGGQVAGARSIQVNYFQNKTAQPRLAEALNHALRRAIQKDGTLRLDTQDGGDIVLTGEISAYERPAVSYQPGDVITVRDYYLAVSARIVARERSSGKVLVERDVLGRTLVRAGADQASAERQALPLLAEDFARRATSLLVDGQW